MISNRTSDGESTSLRIAEISGGREGSVYRAQSRRDSEEMRNGPVADPTERCDSIESPKKQPRRNGS